MAERPKGNLWLELGIVALTIALLFTILYPKNTWKTQDELEAQCHSRMNAIQQLEYQHLNAVNMYEDTLGILLNVVKSDTNLLMALDTTIIWDGIVKKSELKQMVMEKSLPEDLRDLIASRLDMGLPLGRLAQWDSLEYRLLASLKEEIAKSDTSELLDTSINWRTLPGESKFWILFESVQMPTRLKTKTRLDLRKGKLVQETAAWKNLRDTLLITLNSIVDEAEMVDVWTKEQKDEWEKKAQGAWELEMDAMSDTEKDSLWLSNQDKFWDNEKDLLWKKDKRRIWKKEGETWKEENRDTWMRTVESEWKMITKKEWIAEHKEEKPDSVIAIFEATKDSLWKAQLDSLKDAQFASWQKKEKKNIDSKIDGIWDRERQALWEPEAKQAWLSEKQELFDVFWSDFKDGMWNDLRYDLWGLEEKKLARKISALARLDKAVQWNRVVGDEIQNIIANLNLPNNKTVWQKIDKFDPKNGSALIEMGVAPLFSDALLDRVLECPEVALPYQIEVNDTSVVKTFSIACPIKEKEIEKYILGLRAPIIRFYQGEKFKKIGLQFPFVKKVGAKRSYIEQVDPLTGEIEEVVLKPGFFEKVFGAKTIASHGTIAKSGKKSWVKQGN